MSISSTLLVNLPGFENLAGFCGRRQSGNGHLASIPGNKGFHGQPWSECCSKDLFTPERIGLVHEIL
jgi:hypothetical protein